MIILGIETATEHLGAALIARGMVFERRNTTRTAHCELLTVFIGELAAEAGIALRDIEGVAVSVGPGSFTGIRIGIASAMGFAFALGLKTASVDTLTALAWNAAGDGALVCPLIDAKRGEAYAAVYRLHTRSLPETVVEPSVIPVSSLPPFIGDLHEQVTITGPGALRFTKSLDQNGIGYSLPPEERYAPSALSVAEIGAIILANGSAVEPSALKPLYLRRSDAEIARDLAKEKGNC